MALQHERFTYGLWHAHKNKNKNNKDDRGTDRLRTATSTAKRAHGNFQQRGGDREPRARRR